MLEAKDVQTKLAGIQEALDADGYDVIIGSNDPGVVIQISARPEGCSDCLVPKDLMRQMIQTALGTSDDSGEPIELVYPKDMEE